MRPGAAQLLIGAATTLGTRIIPSLDAKSYAEGDAKMIGALLILLAQDAERATDRLVLENAALRALFARAAGHPLAGETVERLKAAAAQQEESFLLADLQHAHDRLEAILIDLHAEVEVVQQDWARSLESAIWSYLLCSAEDRMLVLPDLS
jgi:hypothetical protein